MEQKYRLRALGDGPDNAGRWQYEVPDYRRSSRATKCNPRSNTIDAGHG